MYKVLKFRMYPTIEQEILINKTFGCSRLVYNTFLNICKTKGYRNAFDMCKELKTLYMDKPFLNEVDSCSLRCAIFNLEDAYKNFFDKRNNYPKFKNKYSRQSYRTNSIRSVYKGKEYNNIEVDLINKEIKLPKLKKVKIKGYRNLKLLPGRIINATIIKETTGKYYVGVCVETKEEEKVKPNSIVGIDVGIKNLVVTSDGIKYNNVDTTKEEKTLRRLQRKLSRCKKGSNNREKVKIKIAKEYKKIENKRRHNIINIVNSVIKDNDIIATENLKVTEMLQNKNLSKKISEVAFSKIISYIEWKCKSLGKYFYKVDTYYPSSQICNRCNSRNKKVKNLNIREWECENCHSINDRDINASINIMFEGLKMHYKLKEI